jgi:hypothetical protein
MGWWSKLKKSDDIALISNIIQISQPAWWVFLATGGVVLIIARIVGIGFLIILALSTVALILALLGGWMLIRRFQKNAARRKDWNPWIWAKIRRHRVSVHDKERIDYSSELDLLIMQDDVSRFNWRIGWTGEGAAPQSGIEVELHNPGFDWEIQPTTTNSANVLVITFDRPRNKGEVVKLKFTIKTNGDLRNQRPFYSVTLFESRIPIKAVIEVEFSASVKVENIQQEIYLSDLAAWPISPPEPVLLGFTRTTTWELNCRPGRRYSVVWQYV